MSQHVFRPSTFPGSSIDPVERGVLPMQSAVYGSEDMSGCGARNEPISGLTAGFTRGYSSSIEDPILMGQGREHSVGIHPVLPVNPDLIYERSATMPRIPDIVYERPASQPKVIGLSAPPVDSNILFVDGLPTDCTRREVGHIFRPFIGFEDIKVIHKEPKRSGDKAMVLCFVEFNDAKCALTAMEALQDFTTSAHALRNLGLFWGFKNSFSGYKFDDKKLNAPVLKIHCAHFPFHLPSEHGGQRVGTL